MASRRSSPMSAHRLRLLAFLLTVTVATGAASWGLNHLLGRDGTPPYATVEASGVATDGGATERTAVPMRVVVIDAGHGGEDGGAISAAGAYEKDINLAVARLLRDMLEASGVPVVMTRTEDKLLYNRDVDFEGRKKVLDMAARLNTVTAVRNSLLVSIHMNAFSQAKYSGTQVWYGEQDPRSAAVAKAIQDRAHEWQPSNDRKIKPSAGQIYLLDRPDSPAVLVEGGFMSHPAEAARLCDPAYQRELAFVIYTAIMENLNI